MVGVRVWTRRRGTPRLYQSILVSARIRMTRLAYQFAHRLAEDFTVRVHILGRSRGRH